MDDITMEEVTLLTAVNRLVLIGATTEAITKLEQAVIPLPDRCRPLWCGLHHAAWEFLLCCQARRFGLAQVVVNDQLNCLEQSLRAYFLELPDRDALPQATPRRMRAAPFRRSWETMYGLVG